MRLWTLAQMRMTRKFLLLHNLETLGFKRAFLGVGIQLSYRIGKAGGSSTSWLGLSP